MQLILENVRCFAGRHTIPVKPLTLLVGENNTGKSTLLACLNIACQYPEFPFRARWDDRPYRLGTFDTISTRRKIRSDEVPRFAVGIEDLVLDSSHLWAEYTKVMDRIVPARVRLRWGETILDADVALDGQVPPRTASVAVSHNGNPLPLKRDILFPIFGFDPVWSMIESVAWAIQQESASEILRNFAMIRQLKRPIAISLAPIRSTPRRAYDIEQNGFEDEGSDVPLVLMRHSEGEFEELTRAGLFESLKEFGKASGLFTRIDVRRVGSGGSRSIQVRAVIAGRSFDLTDVGYGVSQVIPVIVKTFVSAAASVVLIQQPEVHLHPQAQAALGSFFVRMAALGPPFLVIETHSDYIVDRIRIEVAQGKIAPDQVEILYFERKGMETQVYPLTLDKLGNILDAPPTYREFFLREELNLLQRTVK